MIRITKFFCDMKIVGGVMVFLALFQTAGCSHLTDVFLINYTDQDVTVVIDGDIVVPKHSHVYGKVFLGGMSGIHLKVTAGAKTLVDRDVDGEELSKNMIGDDLLIWEVK